MWPSEATTEANYNWVSGKGSGWSSDSKGGAFPADRTDDAAVRTEPPLERSKDRK